MLSIIFLATPASVAMGVHRHAVLVSVPIFQRAFLWIMRPKDLRLPAASSRSLLGSVLTPIIMELSAFLDFPVLMLLKANELSNSRLYF